MQFMAVGFSGIVVLMIGMLVIVSNQAVEGSPTPGTCLPVSKGGTGVCSQEDLIDLFYPIGFIYTSTSSTNPGDYLGGTWEAFGDGRTLVGVGNNGTNNYTDSELTGGADSVVLTPGQMPRHGLVIGSGHGSSGASGGGMGGIRSEYTSITNGSLTHGIRAEYGPERGTVVGTWYMTANYSFGNDQAHENRMPYITVYFWKRVS